MRCLRRAVLCPRHNINYNSSSEVRYWWPKSPICITLGLHSLTLIYTLCVASTFAYRLTNHCGIGDFHIFVVWLIFILPAVSFVFWSYLKAKLLQHVRPGTLPPQSRAARVIKIAALHMRSCPQAINQRSACTHASMSQAAFEWSIFAKRQTSNAMPACIYNNTLAPVVKHPGTWIWAVTYP